MQFHYTIDDLSKALTQSGVKPGSTVIVHASLGILGRSEKHSTIDELNAALFTILCKHVGSTGNVLVPCYTYSFARGEIFNLHNTPSAIGPFSEYVRVQPQVQRSEDPLYSVCGIGPDVEKLFSNLPNTSFGPDSLMSRLVEIDALLCTVGLDLFYSILLHHAEEILNVPFRYKKVFRGDLIKGDNANTIDWVQSVRVLADNFESEGYRLSELIRQSKKASTVSVGRGEICAISCKQYFNFICKQLQTNPWISARGPVVDPIEVEWTRVPNKVFNTPTFAGMSDKDFINVIKSIPRAELTDGTNFVMQSLAERLPIQLHHVVTGTETSSGIVPERWVCHEAIVEDAQGRTIFDYEHNFRHFHANSSSQNIKCSFKQLVSRLNVGKQKEEIPFASRGPRRDWGISCAPEQRAVLTDTEYNVRIVSDFCYSTMAVGILEIGHDLNEAVILGVNLFPHVNHESDLMGVSLLLDLYKILTSSKIRKRIITVIHSHPAGLAYGIEKIGGVYEKIYDLDMISRKNNEIEIALSAFLENI